MDGMLLQTVEALGDSSFVGSAGAIWQLLQAEKESVSREILSDSMFRTDAVSPPENEPSEESPRQVDLRHRQILENRLRALNDAQDRLIEGNYGVCLECGKEINARRLCADPSTSLCISCQQIVEGELLTGKL